jgi:hypothetical protein
MSVKLAPTADVPFLKEYTPPELLDAPLLTDVRNMVSYDLQPLTSPLTFTYPVGAADAAITMFLATFRNLTENVILEISQINGTNSIVQIQPTKVVLQPRETRSVPVLLRTPTLNESVGQQIIETLRLRVRNRPIVGPVYRNTTFLLPNKSLTEALQEANFSLPLR